MPITSLPRTTDRPPARWRRKGPAVVLAAVTTGGVTALALTVGTSGGPSTPMTPRAAVEAYLATALSGDGNAHWDLLCRDQQRDVGPREEYLRSVERIATADPVDLFQPRIVGVRPADPAEREGVEVDVVFQSGDGSGWADSVLVVWEDGGFRACGSA